MKVHQLRPSSIDEGYYMSKKSCPFHIVLVYTKIGHVSVINWDDFYGFFHQVFNKNVNATKNQLSSDLKANDEFCKPNDQYSLK